MLSYCTTVSLDYFVIGILCEVVGTERNSIVQLRLIRDLMTRGHAWEVRRSIGSSDSITMSINSCGKTT